MASAGFKRCAHRCVLPADGAGAAAFGHRYGRTSVAGEGLPFRHLSGNLSSDFRRRTGPSHTQQRRGDFRHADDDRRFYHEYRAGLAVCLGVRMEHDRCGAGYDHRSGCDDGRRIRISDPKRKTQL